MVINCPMLLFNGIFISGVTVPWEVEMEVERGYLQGRGCSIVASIVAVGQTGPLG